MKLSFFSFIFPFFVGSCYFGDIGYAQELAKIDVCGVLKLDPGRFDSEKIRTALTTEMCRKWINKKGEILILNLQEKNQKPSSDNIFQIYIIRRQKQSASLVFDLVKHDFKNHVYFDQDRFLRLINEWPIYQERIARVMSESLSKSVLPKALLQVTNTKNGKTLKCTIQYETDKKIRFFEVHLLKETKLFQIYYDSELIDNADALYKVPDHLELLFASIEPI